MVIVGFAVIEGEVLLKEPTGGIFGEEGKKSLVVLTRSEDRWIVDEFFFFSKKLTILHHIHPSELEQTSEGIRIKKARPLSEEDFLKRLDEMETITSSEYNNSAFQESLSKESLADRFFKRFVENEDQIDFTNEDVLKEINFLEKYLKNYDVVEIVLDCCSEEIIGEYLAKTLTAYEDFMDCLVFGDVSLGPRVRRHLKGDLLIIYESAEKWWDVIEDSLKTKIRKFGSYRNYLNEVKPEDKCVYCRREIRDKEGYYSRGDNVYCNLCLKELIENGELVWCKACYTYVRGDDFEDGNYLYCKYCAKEAPP
ncbi:MAG: hypothetical protein ACFE9L_18985 [Candidatus Hodarchaeota archaeon]